MQKSSTLCIQTTVHPSLMEKLFNVSLEAPSRELMKVSIHTHTHVWTFLANISESLKPWAAATLLSPGNFYHFCLWCQSKAMLPILSKTDYYCPCTWEPQVQSRHQHDHILGHQEVKIEIFCLMSSQFSLL